jgi:CYTH domain-containing protein
MANKVKGRKVNMTVWVCDVTHPEPGINNKWLGPDILPDLLYSAKYLEHEYNKKYNFFQHEGKTYEIDEFNVDFMHMTMFIYVKEISAEGHQER